MPIKYKIKISDGLQKIEIIHNRITSGNQLSQIISNICNVNEDDVLVVLLCLSEVIISEISNSSIVDLGELGKLYAAYSEKFDQSRIPKGECLKIVFEPGDKLSQMKPVFKRVKSTSI